MCSLFDHKNRNFTSLLGQKSNHNVLATNVLTSPLLALDKMIVSIPKSALSNRNVAVVVNVDNNSNDDIMQQTTTGSRQKNSRYSSYADSIISSSYLSYVTDDSNSHLSYDDDDSLEESSLTAWIEKCILRTSSSSSLSSNDHDEDIFDYPILDDDDDNNIDELVDHMILACDVDSDTVIRSTDLQNSCRIASSNSIDFDSTTTTGSSSGSSRGNIESVANRKINSRKDVYLKILRKETIPSPIENKHSISDEIFNDNYYGYI